MKKFLFLLLAFPFAVMAQQVLMPPTPGAYYDCKCFMPYGGKQMSCTCKQDPTGGDRQELEDRNLEVILQRGLQQRRDWAKDNQSQSQPFFLGNVKGR